MIELDVLNIATTTTTTIAASKTASNNNSAANTVTLVIAVDIGSATTTSTASITNELNTKQPHQFQLQIDMMQNLLLVLSALYPLS